LVAKGFVVWRNPAETAARVPPYWPRACGQGGTAKGDSAVGGAASGIQPHHWLSQGVPSWLPSIFVPGQFLRKNLASAQEVIWLQ